MTSILQDDDKILNMYKQYKELLGYKAEGINSIAAQLAVAHMIDHVVCLLKSGDEETVKVRKLN